MNWLHPLTEQIMAQRDFVGEQRRALVLWVNELALICDQHVPHAPSPEMLVNDSTMLQVNWILNDRYFAIGVPPSLRLLLTMNDHNGNKREVDPTHVELKRYVLCLFDGWKP